MELNLDRLNGLRFVDFQEKQPSKTPTDELLGAEEYKTSIEVKKPLEALTEGLEGINKLSNVSCRISGITSDLCAGTSNPLYVSKSFI